MLAAGDCQGAAQFAFEKGRLELGQSIAQDCRPMQQIAPNPAQAAYGTRDLPTYLRNTAANTKVPLKLDEITTVSKIEAVGSELLLTAVVATNETSISDADRSRLINNICAYKSSAPLLRAGASIRVVYLQQSGHQIGAAMATRQECGL
jgi:hypothetical protein